MKQRTSEENKDKKKLLLLLLPELAYLLLAGGSAFFISLYAKDDSMERALQNMVLILLGTLATCAIFRTEYMEGVLDYDNERHLLRFYIALLSCLVLAIACCFLPSGGWPFLAVFVILSLFSSLPVGILAASGLLMFPVLLAGQGAAVFFVYFVSGAFSASLFRHLDKEFAIGIPSVLSLSSLLLCETAGILLTTNEQLGLELFLVPAANLILSGMILLGTLRWFSSSVVFRERVRLLELNDTENEVLAAYREENREEYYFCVHTGHFCERIAQSLNLDADELKCIALYHKGGRERMLAKDATAFPKRARSLLDEYEEGKGRLHTKEVSILFISANIVEALLAYLHANPTTPPDYERLVGGELQKMLDSGRLSLSELTLQEWNEIVKIIRKEKLYYDFLR